MKSGIAFGILAAAGVVISAAEAEVLLVNPNFNEGFKGWSENLPCWSVETGAGMNGSRGLVLRCDEPVEPKWMTQRVTLKPGRRYRFGCWMKRNVPAGCNSVANFAIEWTDKRGKYMGGAYMGSKRSNGEWVSQEACTKEIPEGIGQANLIIYFDTKRLGPVRGEFAFDDFFLKEADLKPISAVTTSAYRNEIVDQEEVRFLAQAAAPTGVDAGDFSVTFSWTGADGVRRERSSAINRSGVASVAATPDEFAFGTNDVIVTANVRGRGRVAECRLPVSRVRSPSPRRCRLDRYGRCIRDGKPFFPHGMYFSKATDDDLDIYTNSPFNVIMPYHAPTPEQMDSIARHGLMTFVSMQNDLCSCSKDKYRQFLESKYGRFKRHPALFAWYVFDEAPVNEAERRVRAYEAMTEWDPDRLCWAVFCHEHFIPEFFGAMDVVGLDPYPVGNGMPLSDVVKFCRRVNWYYNGAFPMWNVPQAFDWGNYRPRQESAHRMPTKAELRNINWQHIAGGANGLVSYSFFDLRRQKNFEADWRSVREVAYEIDRYVPVILSDPGPKAAASDDVVVRTWQKDGEIWVLAVNPKDKSFEGVVWVPGLSGKPTVEFGEAQPTLGAGGALTYRLEPCAVSLVHTMK